MIHAKPLRMKARPRRTQSDPATCVQLLEPHDGGTGEALCIVDLAERHQRDWRRLWRSYARFYRTRLDEEVTRNTWTMILSNDAVIGLGAERAGFLAGFAIVITHPATWSPGGVAYLEDLFVRKDARGLGIGRALMREAFARARGRDLGSVYWHTEHDNWAARALYDDFGAADGFVRYRIPLT